MVDGNIMGSAIIAVQMDIGGVAQVTGIIGNGAAVLTGVGHRYLLAAVYTLRSVAVLATRPHRISRAGSERNDLSDIVGSLMRR